MAREWKSNEFTNNWKNDSGGGQDGTVPTKENLASLWDDLLGNGFYLDPATDTQPYLRWLAAELKMGAKRRIFVFHRSLEMTPGTLQIASLQVKFP